MPHIDVRWSEDGSGSPCNFHIDKYGRLTVYIPPRLREPETVSIIFQRPERGRTELAYHTLLDLIKGRPDYSVKFHDFPELWW